MFDKNAFKDAFRAWATSHLLADEEEARAFCQSLIPVEVFATHYWLLEQSVQWFVWLKRRDHALDEEGSADEERLVC